MEYLTAFSFTKALYDTAKFKYETKFIKKRITYMIISYLAHCFSATL